jgi:predicted nucleic acid-binding protein
MVTALLDTAVVVDVLRGYPPAVAWLDQQGHLGVSTVVWLEIIQGASDRRAEQVALRLLQRFERIDATTADVDWALHQLLRFHLSHGLDAMDALIAAASYRLSLPLYTRNIKHFTPLLGSFAQKPYE